MKVAQKSQRQKKVSELLREIISDFISKQSNKTSLITITSIDISPDFKNCLVYVSVFPEESFESGLNFLKRKRREIKAEVRKKTNMKNVPFFDFDLDIGEKNRQKIEEISSKK